MANAVQRRAATPRDSTLAKQRGPRGGKSARLPPPCGRHKGEGRTEREVAPDARKDESRVKRFAMASRTEIGVVYGAAIVQGLALVTFPAARSIFTSPGGFGFDSTRYGTMFVPQVVLAILASGLAPKLARRWSLRRVLLVGFAGNIVSMALLALTRLLLGAPDVAFGVLLVATAALGLGFGATVMALNTYAETFFPQRADGAVLALNALLGLRTALAPGLV